MKVLTKATRKLLKAVEGCGAYTTSTPAVWQAGALGPIQHDNF